MSTHIKYIESDVVCSKCGEKVLIECDQEEKLVRGIIKFSKAPTGWHLCACGFEFEEPKPKGAK